MNIMVIGVAAWLSLAPPPGVGDGKDLPRLEAPEAGPLGALDRGSPKRTRPLVYSGARYRLHSGTGVAGPAFQRRSTSGLNSLTGDLPPNSAPNPPVPTRRYPLAND